MGNRLMTTPNHVIMGVTTNYSLIVHGLAFFDLWRRNALWRARILFQQRFHY